MTFFPLPSFGPSKEEQEKTEASIFKILLDIASKKLKDDLEALSKKIIHDIPILSADNDIRRGLIARLTQLQSEFRYFDINCSNLKPEVIDNKLKELSARCEKLMFLAHEYESAIRDFKAQAPNASYDDLYKALKITMEIAENKKMPPSVPYLNPPNPKSEFQSALEKNLAHIINPADKAEAEKMIKEKAEWRAQIKKVLEPTEAQKELAKKVAEEMQAQEKKQAEIISAIPMPIQIPPIPPIQIPPIPPIQILPLVANNPEGKSKVLEEGLFSEIPKEPVIKFKGTFQEGGNKMAETTVTGKGISLQSSSGHRIEMQDHCETRGYTPSATSYVMPVVWGSLAAVIFLTMLLPFVLLMNMSTASPKPVVSQVLPVRRVHTQKANRDGIPLHEVVITFEVPLEHLERVNPLFVEASKARGETTFDRQLTLYTSEYQAEKAEALWQKFNPEHRYHAEPKNFVVNHRNGWLKGFYPAEP